MKLRLSQRATLGLLELTLPLIVCASITFSIAYNNYEAFSHAIMTAEPPGDTAEYLQAYLDPQALFSDESHVQFRAYRLATPLLARLVPDPPQNVFRSGRPLDPMGAAVFKFAIVTALFNLATCLVIYAICRRLQLSRLLSLLGAALYSTLTFVVVVDGIPHVDAVFFFAFALGSHAVLTRNIGLIVVTTVLGTFIKEAIFLLGVLALLLPAPMRSRVMLIAAMVPGALVYVAVRYIALPSSTDYFASGTFIPLAGVALHNLITLNGIEWVFMGFNFLWLPILWTLFRGRADPTLVRWSLFLPVLIIVTVGAGSDHFGRSMPLAAPVAIPLALLALKSLLELVEQREGELAMSVSDERATTDNTLKAAEHGLSPEPS